MRAQDAHELQHRRADDHRHQRGQDEQPQREVVS
jgi:hypothetical protein